MFDFLTALLSIILIDVVLSSDNAVVIGMAAHRLPAAQSRRAILFGGGAAIVLRIVLTAAAAALLALPGVHAVGGCLLVWIGYRLLRLEEEHAEGVPVTYRLREAVTTIVLADIVMSLDNVLGVAAASRGNLWLLALGLLLSMSLLMAGGALVAALLDRLPWLVYLGAGVIVWTGLALALDDPLLSAGGRYLDAQWHLPLELTITLVVLALAHYVHRHRPTRLRRGVGAAASH